MAVVDANPCVCVCVCVCVCCVLVRACMYVCVCTYVRAYTHVAIQTCLLKTAPPPKAIAPSPSTPTGSLTTLSSAALYTLVYGNKCRDAPHAHTSTREYDSAKESQDCRRHDAAIGAQRRGPCQRVEPECKEVPNSRGLWPTNQQTHRNRNCTTHMRSTCPESFCPPSEKHP